MSTVYGEIRPIRNKVLVKNIDKGIQKTKGGIIIPDDNGIDRGIKPRWAQVYRVGKDIDWLKQDEWCLIEHGRWSEGIKVDTGSEVIELRLADPDCILGTSDTQPEEAQIGRL